MESMKSNSALCLGVKTVNQYQRAVILRLGRIKDGHGGGAGPGAFFTLCCTDEFHVVDMRTGMILPTCSNF